MFYLLLVECLVPFEGQIHDSYHFAGLYECQISGNVLNAAFD